VCIAEVHADGVIVVCSHGGPGEACALDEHCDSGMCVAQVNGSGVTSACA